MFIDDAINPTRAVFVIIKVGFCTLSSAFRFVDFSLLKKSSYVQMRLYQFDCLSSSATFTNSVKEAVADSTWVQSILAQQLQYVLYIFLYIGEVNNSNKTMIFVNELHGIHGYSQQ